MQEPCLGYWTFFNHLITEGFKLAFGLEYDHHVKEYFENCFNFKGL